MIPLNIETQKKRGALPNSTLAIRGKCTGVSSDDIEWEPPDDEIEWGILGLEQSEPNPIKFTKKLVQYLRGFNSKWIITF